MYISKFILIKKFFENDKSYNIIYLKDEKKLIKINTELYNKLVKLYNRYGDNKISVDDPIFHSLIESNNYNIILKNKLFIEKKLNKLDNFNVDINLKTVYIHLTLSCNLSCSYCYMRYNLKSSCSVEFYNFEKWLYKFKKIGVNHIILTGGEPTLHKDFKDIIKLIKKEGFYLTLLTNGTNIDSLELNYIDKCIISMDLLGTNQRKGLNIKKLLHDLGNIDFKYKNKILVRSIVSSGQESKINITREKMNNLSINHIIEICIPNNIYELKCIPDIKKIWEFCNQSKNDFNVFTNCGACNSVIAVNYNGDIYPCQACMLSELKITNLESENWLNELVNSKIRKDFLNSHIDNIEKCKNCNLRYFCGGGCRAIAYKLYGSTFKKNECLCNTYKYIINNSINSIKFS